MLVVSDFDRTLADFSSLANLRERRACRVIHSRRSLVVTYVGINYLIGELYSWGHTWAIVTHSS